MTHHDVLKRMYYAQSQSKDDGLILYHPLTEVLATLPTGQRVTISGTNYAPGTYQGIACMDFAATSTTTYFSMPFPFLVPGGAWEGTISLWLAKQGISPGVAITAMTVGRINNFTGGGSAFVIRRGSASSARLSAGICNNNGRETMRVIINEGDASWHHVAMLCGKHGTQYTTDIYLDGAGIGNVTITTTDVQSMAAMAGLRNVGTRTGAMHLAAFRIYKRKLSADEIVALAHEFTPTEA
ncbi:MAG: hypothetical protein IJS08_17000 [Victivallales bacterium]|nr:hypothetical protein [Victivallales bacterium]